MVVISSSELWAEAKGSGQDKPPEEVTIISQSIGRTELAQAPAEEDAWQQPMAEPEISAAEVGNPYQITEVVVEESPEEVRVYAFLNRPVTGMEFEVLEGIDTAGQAFVAVDIKGARQNVPLQNVAVEDSALLTRLVYAQNSTNPDIVRLACGLAYLVESQVTVEGRELIITLPWQRQPAKAKPEQQPIEQAEIPENSDSLDNYVIGPGDVLELHIWGIPGELSLTTMYYRTQTIPDIRVAPDGQIFIPVLGNISVGGKTFKEAKEAIINRAKVYYKEINISVILKILGSFRVYVFGEVKKPGLYPTSFAAGSGIWSQEESRLMNFIKMADGFTSYADKARVQVVRSHPETGREEIIEVDIYKLEQEGDLSQNILIRKGDTILVLQTMNSVYVLGQVHRPGAYPYVEKARLLDYVMRAGGVRDDAAASNVGVIRGEGEEAEVIAASLNDLIKWGRKGPTFAILPGDIVYVPKGFMANWKDILNFLGVVKSSATYVRGIRNEYHYLQQYPGTED